MSLRRLELDSKARIPIVIVEMKSVLLQAGKVHQSWTVINDVDMVDHGDRTWTHKDAGRRNRQVFAGVHQFLTGNVVTTRYFRTGGQQLSPAPPATMQLSATSDMELSLQN